MFKLSLFRSGNAPFLLLDIISISVVLLLTVQTNAFSALYVRQSATPSTRLFSNNANHEAIDALRSLNDFHEGLWRGKATSFTITSDQASGVVQRKSLDPYQVSVKVGIDMEESKGAVYRLKETFEWDSKMSIRSVDLVDANADVDSVDGSYSLDSSQPTLPVDLIGTGNLLHFCVEHNIAINDKERIRCFILYGVDKALARVVVCEEERVEEAKTPSSDVSSTTDAIANKVDSASLLTIHPNIVTPPSESSPPELIRHTTNLLELSSGVWLGDAMIRSPKRYEEPKGFDTGKKMSKLSLKKKNFADWSVGVQKVAHQWGWNFGDAVKKSVSVGKPLGNGLDAGLSVPISGVVCANESLMSRIPKDQRMVYVDWSSCGSAWFLLNHVSVQVRSSLTFCGCHHD
jgi:hypothetical protein